MATLNLIKVINQITISKTKAKSSVTDIFQGILYITYI